MSNELGRTLQTSAPEKDAARSIAILAVDDEPSVLEAIKRLLRADGIEVRTASSGGEALRVLEDDAESIGVIVSDYAMPGMSGAELLGITSGRWPDLTRVLLTGNADLEAASRAVNEGQLSRLYTKPWQPAEFRRAITQALEQHRVLSENRRLRALAEEQAARLAEWNQSLETQVAERTAELEQANLSLQKGLLGTVQLLLGMLEQRLPERAARCKEVARLAARLAERANMPKPEIRWVQVAALIHDLGLTSLPDSLLRRPPAELLLNQRVQYERHPLIGQKMLSRVDELTRLGTWVRHHHERWDGNGYPDRLAGPNIPLPSRIIALTDAYLEAASIDSGTAPMWRRAQMSAGAFDPDLVTLLQDELSGAPMPTDTPRGGARVAVENLREGMILAEPILTTSGSVLLPDGEMLTADQVARVVSFSVNAVLRTTSVAIEGAVADK
jgi:response regulator RpfG family c-di-GMP phosphodiesterase